MLDLEKLNNKQLEAVKHKDGPLLVLAGAGSGKTFTMITRISYLVETQNVKPHEIMAVTFTNKAAKEMKERAEKMIGKQAEYITISTFHSFCARFLRKECIYTSLNNNFSIIDDKDSKNLLKKIIKENADYSSLTEEELKQQEQEDKKAIDSYYSWIGSLKSELLPAKYIRTLATFLLNPLGDSPDLPWYIDKMKVLSILDKIPQMYRLSLADVYEQYEELLYKNNCIDFEGLIYETVYTFIKNPKLLDWYQEKLKYIIVDEYQDTNHSQYILMKLLAEKYKNVAVVGDDAQSIYSFRNADIRNILNFKKDYPDAHEVKLEQNYRSTTNILELANEVISNNKNQIQKNLWSNIVGGHPVKYSVFDTVEEESKEIANTINGLIRTGNYKFSDFTILYRVNAQSRSLEDVFLQNKLPYSVIGGFSFYQRKEIKTLCSYLNVLANDKNDEELLKIINVPKRGIGDTTVEKCVVFARKNNISLLESLKRCNEYLKGTTSNKILEFVNILEDLKNEKDIYGVGCLVEMVYSGSGYQDFLEEELKNKKPDAQDRIENITEFINLAWEYQSENEGTLEDFMEMIYLNQQNFEKEEKENYDKIKLMTIHSSKGLEFPVVFCIGLEESILPYKKALEEGNVEEERRLCYVAITRAQQRLYISRVHVRKLYKDILMNEPSRFLTEMHLEEKKNKALNPWA